MPFTRYAVMEPQHKGKKLYHFLMLVRFATLFDSRRVAFSSQALVEASGRAQHKQLLAHGSVSGYTFRGPRLREKLRARGVSNRSKLVSLSAAVAFFCSLYATVRKKPTQKVCQIGVR